MNLCFPLNIRVSFPIYECHTMYLLIVIYIYFSDGYKVLVVVSIRDNETHDTGENLVKPVQVFVTTTCHSTSNVAPRAPVKRERFKLRTNISNPKAKEINELFRKVTHIAPMGV